METPRDGGSYHNVSDGSPIAVRLYAKSPSLMNVCSKTAIAGQKLRDAGAAFDTFNQVSGEIGRPQRTSLDKVLSPNQKIYVLAGEPIPAPQREW